MNDSRKVGVLFMQSQAFWGSDSMIHGLIMQNLDRQRHQVHVAVNSGIHGRPSAALTAVRQIPKLYVRPTNFGVSVNGQAPKAIAGQLVRQGAPSLASVAALLKYARQNRIGIIHGTEKPRDAFYGSLLSRLSGARHIIHLHVKVESWISPLSRWAMRRADALVGVSDFVARSAVSMGFAPGKTTQVLNAIDSSRWDPAISGTPVRNELGLHGDTPVLAVISRLFPWKGHHELLRALARVKLNCPEVILLIVGEDDPRATPGRKQYSAELRSLVVELGLSNHVIFTGFRSNIAELLAAADIFTMPSFEEPCAVAYLEAMAMKKPIIALDSGGTPQLVEHGKTGLLSKPGDIEQLAHNIVQLVNEPGLRRQMGQHGRSRVERDFAPVVLARNVEAVYARLLRGLPASGQIAEFH